MCPLPTQSTRQPSRHRVHNLVEGGSDLQRQRVGLEDQVLLISNREIVITVGMGRARLALRLNEWNNGIRNWDIGRDDTFRISVNSTVSYYNLFLSIPSKTCSNQCNTLGRAGRHRSVGSIGGLFSRLLFIFSGVVTIRTQALWRPCTYRTSIRHHF